MEKLRKLPSFSVGINLQSLTGFQNINGNERYYATYPRFAYVQAGINIPIYQKANDAYIKAAKLNEKITTEKVELLQFQLEQSYQIYEQEVKKYEKLVLYYENKLFPQRLKLLQLANQEYLGGELSFVEWLNVIQQYQNISLQYIETQQQLYKAQAALYYFVKYE